jgi:NADH-quinone oxidoreductase subunit M
MWGGERRRYAALKFFLFTAFGSALMLAGILALALMGGSFGFEDLLEADLSRTAQFWLFGAFALSFGIKVPLFPLHTWLPDAHVEAPTAGSVILAGVLLKLGAYGLIRFNLTLFPEAAVSLVPVLAALALVGIIYGAVVATMQKDLKRLVAYSSVSHLGFVVLGICAMNVNGVQGAVYQMLAHGVSTGGLFLLVGMLSDRRHTRLISEFGGLKQVMPMFVRVFFLVTLASIALPLTNGFVGEFLILLGTYRWDWRFAAMAASGVILSAVYMLWMFQRVNYGPVTNPKNEKLPDLTPREWAAILPIAAMAVVMGVLPNLFLSPMEPAVERMVQRMERGQVSAAQVKGAAPPALPAAHVSTPTTPTAGLQPRVE